jgi:hypothetical protein
MTILGAVSPGGMGATMTIEEATDADMGHPPYDGI